MRKYTKSLIRIRQAQRKKTAQVCIKVGTLKIAVNLFRVTITNKQCSDYKIS